VTKKGKGVGGKEGSKFLLVIVNKRVIVDGDEDLKAPGVKHSAILVCSANFVRSPMAHGILSKMLTDIGKRETEGRGEGEQRRERMKSGTCSFISQITHKHFNNPNTGKRKEWALASAGH
jgi:hypothetical protein